MDRVYAFLHLFFAFGFVGSLVVADWNARAARAVPDWGARATLLDIVARSTRVAGMGSLVLLGVFGNLLSAVLGYRMATDGWMRWVNGLWVAAVLLMGLVCLPGIRRLCEIARRAAQGGAPDGYDRAMARWRLANAALSVVYLALLVLMVFRWRS